MGPADRLKVSLDLNDRNNYMPKAMHPTVVVQKARDCGAVPVEMQECSNTESETKFKSDSVYPSPQFRQPDLPFQSDNPRNQSRHQMMLMRE